MYFSAKVLHQCLRGVKDTSVLVKAVSIEGLCPGYWPYPIQVCPVRCVTQATKRDRRLLLDETHAVYNLWC